MECTIFKDIKTTSTGFNKPVVYLLNRIKTGTSKELILKLRAEIDEEKQKELKKLLPSICFSGTFLNRSIKGLINHSGIICLDFDKFLTKELLTEWQNKLINDKFTYSCFISPSGNGLKVLVKIPKDPENHKLYFDSLKDYYNCPFFDASCSDVSRVCFESFDENIYINENSEIYTEKAKVNICELGTTTPSIAVKSENRIIQNLLKWFDSNYSMIQNRNTNLFKLAMAFNDYGVSKNECENVLFSYSQKDFPIREIELIINSAYKNTSNFGTKFFEDNFTKNKLEKYIRGGKSINEIKKELKEFSTEEVENSISTVKQNLSITDFWNYSAKGNISLSHHKYKSFLEEMQFFKFFPEGNNSFVFVKINENLLENTNEFYIKDYILTYLQNRNDIGTAPFDFMAASTKYFKDDYLSFLKTAEINLKKDTENYCYLYFKNCVVEVSKDSVNKIEYIDLDGFVWKNQIIDREYKEIESNNCMFDKFIRLVCDNNEDKYFSLVSVIGYLLHSYKTSANNKAIILNDETISENPNGGSGKGLFSNALGQMKKLNIIDGKSFSFDGQFKFQTVSPDCQILLFDDVKKNFDFESLFSAITEGITIEKKNIDAIRIPVKKSPKILITTNYTVGGVGGSFERRKFEVEFSSYFNSNHTPLDEFGCMLFDEWDDLEFLRFDNFMIECLKYYLTFGLKKHDFKNLEVRKFIKETSFEFFEWTNENNLEANTVYYKNEIFENFLNDYTDLKRWLTKKRFSLWIENYAKSKNLIFETGKNGNIRWINLKSK